MEGFALHDDDEVPRNLLDQILTCGRAFALTSSDSAAKNSHVLVDEVVESGIPAVMVVRDTAADRGASVTASAQSGAERVSG